MKNLQTTHIPPNTESEHKRLTKHTIILLLVGFAFLILFIVFIILHKTELNRELDNIDWEKADAYLSCLETFGGLLIAWIIGFPIIQIFRAIYQEQKQIQKQNALKEQCVNFINENKRLLDTLTNQFYEPIKNFIDSCPNFYFSLNSSSIKEVGYELFNKNCLCASYLEKDGFPIVSKLPLLLEEQRRSHNNLSILIQGLKTRISKIWTDSNTLDAVIYLVFRNNLIEYFYNSYIEKFNCETLFELCSTFEKGIVDSSMFTYYYLFKNDINAPIVPAFNQICAEITSIFEQIEKAKLERAFFNTTNQEEPTKSLNISQPFSHIEKIDISTVDEVEKHKETLIDHSIAISQRK